MPVKPQALSDAQRRTLRGLLEERRALLRGELGAARRAVTEEENPREGPEDEALADVEASMRVAVTERDARELEMIAQALTRMDKGTYGECIDCGEPIAWARMRANPETLRCLKCEEAAERRL